MKHKTYRMYAPVFPGEYKYPFAVHYGPSPGAPHGVAVVPRDDLLGMVKLMAKVEKRRNPFRSNHDRYLALLAAIGIIHDRELRMLRIKKKK